MRFAPVRSPLATIGIAACAAGVAISAYLTSVHFSDAPLFCSTTGTVSCERVLQSTYAEVLGIPVSLFGLAWFVVMGALVATRLASWATLAWAAVGIVTVAWLVFVELARVEAICLWCTAAHALVLLLAGLALVAASRPRGKPA